MKPPADHPPSCRKCQGTGWQPGEPITETIYGRPHRYNTVEPCTHRWTSDEHGYRPPTDYLPADHPKAMAALAAGYIDGQHDLWEMSGGQHGAENPNRNRGVA